MMTSSEFTTDSPKPFELLKQRGFRKKMGFVFHPYIIGLSRIAFGANAIGNIGTNRNECISSYFEGVVMTSFLPCLLKVHFH